MIILKNDNVKIITFIILTFAILLFYPSTIYSEDSAYKASALGDIKFGEASLIDDFSSYAFDANELDSLFKSDDYRDRAKAALALGNNCASSTEECLSRLIIELNKEIVDPLSLEYLEKYLTTKTNYLKREYYFNIYNLLMNESDDLLTPYIENSDGELHQRLVIVSGHLGNTEVREEIRNIYTQCSDPEIRWLAIDVMNRLPEKSDIPLLKLALEDDYYEVDRFGNKYWLIKGTAAGALINFGFSIERTGDNYETWVIVKEPE